MIVEIRQFHLLTITGWIWSDGIPGF